MDKIAIISDIHGNLTALKTVLKDIKERDIKVIVCLGDIVAKGINVNECIRLVKDECDIIIQGNCDRYYTTDHDIKVAKNLEEKRIIWNKTLINEENKKFIRELPFSYEMMISGSLVRFFHARPDIDNETIISFDDPLTKSIMFKPSNKTISDKVADVVVFGHTHQHYLEKLYNKTLCNCGSVGNPIDIIRDEKFDSSVFETINAHYLIIEGVINGGYGNPLNFNFVRIPYDIDSELSMNENNIELDIYKKELYKGCYRDMKKIEVFFKKKNIKLK